MIFVVHLSFIWSFLFFSLRFKKSLFPDAGDYVVDESELTLDAESKSADDTKNSKSETTIQKLDKPLFDQINIREKIEANIQKVDEDMKRIEKSFREREKRRKPKVFSCFTFLLLFICLSYFCFVLFCLI